MRGRPPGDSSVGHDTERVAHVGQPLRQLPQTAAGPGVRRRGGAPHPYRSAARLRPAASDSAEDPLGLTDRAFAVIAPAPDNAG
ncbi:hypothetical protein AB0E81_35535 [Streptomyces sp. NPDC033538]|uniref:hypothetical protein n=1 Tax=Streptomyces sp. NPDC033538 TaxID=3155367 RepID=UPI0033F825B0